MTDNENDIPEEKVEEPKETEEALPEEPKTKVAEETPQVESEEEKKEESLDADAEPEPAKEVEEEPVAEEAKAEAEPEEVAVAEEVEEAPEKDVEALSKTLSVVQEVRGELANAYKTQKEQIMVIDSLNKQLESLNKDKEEMVKTVEELNKNLTAYKEAEELSAFEARKGRLEVLSGSFVKLGQKKTIEELSVLSDDVINEFEVITALALNKQSEESLSEPMTVSTQAMKSTKPVQAEPVPTRKSVEELSTRDVIASITDSLRSLQGQDTSRPGKRVNK